MVNQMRHTLLPVLAIFFALCLPISGYGGRIKTSIVSHYTVERSGKIGLEFEIINMGDATAYNIIATIFLADWAQKYDYLGDNPPGGRIHLESLYHDPRIKPGRHTVVVRIIFEEQSGRPHRAYHFLEIPYRLEQSRNYDPGLALHLDSPLFNTKAFWQPGGNIRLFLKNGHNSPIKPFVSFYLPDGFMTREPNRYYELSPGEERMETVRLTRDPSVRQDRAYNVVVWYEQNEIHYSQHVEGRIRVEERPVYLKWYLLLGTAVLVILFLVKYSCNRRGRKEHSERYDLQNSISLCIVRSQRLNHFFRLI